MYDGLINVVNNVDILVEKPFIPELIISVKHSDMSARVQSQHASSLVSHTWVEPAIMSSSILILFMKDNLKNYGSGELKSFIVDKSL